MNEDQYKLLKEILGSNSFDIDQIIKIVQKIEHEAEHRGFQQGIKFTLDNIDPEELLP